MDPFGLPQVHFLVLSYCDLETLKSARLVNKAWCAATTSHMRKRSIIDLTDLNLNGILDTVELNSKLHRLNTFPSTSFRIRHSLKATPSFTKFFGFYGSKLVEMLESGVIPFVQTFASYACLNLLSNLKEFRIARIYNSWESHSYVVSERIATRISIYETLFTLAPNLNKLHFDTRLGPPEWLRFIKVTVSKLNQLRHLYFSIFSAEDSDEYFVDGVFKKKFNLDQVFLHHLPTRVREIGSSSSSVKLESLSWNLLTEEKYKLHIELMQGLLELLGLVKDTLRHLEIRFTLQHPHRPDPTSDSWSETLESSFPILTRLESLKMHYLYTEAPVLQNFPLNKMPKLKRLALSLVSAARSPNGTIDNLDMEEWLSVFSCQNTTVEHLDLENFTLVAFNSKMLPRIVSKFLTLKTLKIDFHPTSKISAKNLKTIFSQLRSLDQLCIRIFGSNKDFYAPHFPVPDVPERKMERMLVEGWINWTETLTGIPSGAMALLREMTRDGAGSAGCSHSHIERPKIRSFRVAPSLVNLKCLRVLQIVDETPAGILNDDICRFGFMRMKRLRQLRLSSTRNISDECLDEMKLMLDIRKCEVTTPSPARNSLSRITQLDDEDSSSSSDSS